jgi:23S rRNA pseudouridine1911/1915/1917 synthase
MDTHEITLTEAGRIDRVLSSALGQSRNQVEHLIRSGLVAIEGQTVTKGSVRVSGGERVRYRLPAVEPRSAQPIDIDVEILYEDEALLVVNKPAGLVVHPAPSVKEPTLVDWLIGQGISLSTLAGEERHGIVHRIDKETTGALAIAKTNQAHRILSAQLQDRSMGRFYLAVIDRPLKNDCTVDAPIARHPKNRLKMGIVPEGKPARTAFVQLDVGARSTALIAAKLATGRTHQIRVHLGTLGRHILGDRLYGIKSKEGKISRIYLHAYVLYLIHPLSGEPLEIVAPLHEDMSAYLQHHFDKERLHEILQPESIRRRFA